MFWPAVASDLKNRSPTMQVPGRDVPVFIGCVLAAPPAACLPVNVFVSPRVATVALEGGPVSVTPSGIVSVAPVAGAVIVTLLIVVALATPSVGVVKLGESSGASECVPAGSVEFVVAVAVIVAANAPTVIRELPSANVSVAPAAGAVNVSLLIVPGRRKAEGMESVQVPVVVMVQVPVAVTWLGVPATTTLVTVPDPPPPLPENGGLTTWAKDGDRQILTSSGTSRVMYFIESGYPF